MIRITTQSGSVYLVDPELKAFTRESKAKLYRKDGTVSTTDTNGNVYIYDELELEICQRMKIRLEGVTLIESTPVKKIEHVLDEPEKPEEMPWMGKLIMGVIQDVIQEGR